MDFKCNKLDLKRISSHTFMIKVVLVSRANMNKNPLIKIRDEMIKSLNPT